ncbi:MAG: hypothetical protein K9J21_07260 [Bacteroidales bacterium]|nr:hypothetical protein [Bacteroidales bacterium]
MNNGWIKLYRQFLQWEWYDDINTKVLFIHLLLKANYKENSWHGIKIKRGQLITGLHSLSFETKLSIKQIRNSLQKLQKTGEIDKQSGNQFSIITICNYDQYNNIDEKEGKQTDKQRASKGQAKGNTLRKEERKEIKNNILDFDFKESYKNILIEWFQYKKDRKESYKNQMSRKKFYSKLYRMSNGDPEKAQKIIDQSIANNYAGIFELQSKNRQQSNQNTGRHIPNVD